MTHTPDNGQGSIYKRKNSRFYWVSYYDASGKRHLVSSGTENKAKAYALLSRLQSGAEKPKPNKSQERTLLQQMIARLRARVESGEQATGSEWIDLLRIKRFISYCEQKRDIRYIQEIDGDVLRGFISWMQKKYKSSNSTVNRYIDTICGLMPHKVDITRLPRGKGIGKEIPLNVLKSILDAAEPEFRLFLVLLAETALRSGHLCKAEWSWVKAYDIAGETRYFIAFPPEASNSHKRAPLIPLNDFAMAAINALPRTGKYIFSNKNGEQWLTANRVARRWRRLVRKVGHLEFRAYDLRHTWAIREIMRTGDISYVAAVLGHSTPATTLSYYQNLSNARILERSLGSGITRDI